MLKDFPSDLVVFCCRLVISFSKTPRLKERMMKVVSKGRFYLSTIRNLRFITLPSLDRQFQGRLHSNHEKADAFRRRRPFPDGGCRGKTRHQKGRRGYGVRRDETGHPRSHSQQERITKGDVLAVAQLAGIQGAKQTPFLVPLCHPLQLTSVILKLDPDPDLPGVRISAQVEATDRTGVEMEALTAVSVAALTVYDMCKAVDKGMVLSDIRLEMKSGGKSGTFRRETD